MVIVQRLWLWNIYVYIEHARNFIWFHRIARCMVMTVHIVKILLRNCWINFFSLTWGEERKIWKSLFDYVTILLIDFFFLISAFRHTPSFVQFDTLYLFNKNLVRFVVSWNFIVDSLTTCSWVYLCCCDVSSPVCCVINPFCLVESHFFRSSSSLLVCCGPGKGH